MKPIITLTLNPTIDASASVANVFPDHKLRCGDVRHDPGGGGINVARVIHRLGGECLALLCTGGPHGVMLGALLAAEEVHQLRIPISGNTRENLTITEIATGQQYRFVMPGPVLLPAEWDQVLMEIDQITPEAGVFVASGSLPPEAPVDFYAQVGRMLRDRDSFFILDTSGPPLRAALSHGVSLIKPSLRELRTLANEPLETEAEQEHAARRLIETGQCEMVVISLGAAGVIFGDKNGFDRMHSPVVPVRSRVGAGDSMVAGLALGLSQHRSLYEAMRLGVAAGAAAVMTVGTQLCARADVERLYGGRLIADGRAHAHALAEAFH